MRREEAHNLKTMDGHEEETKKRKVEEITLEEQDGDVEYSECPMSITDRPWVSHRQFELADNKIGEWMLCYPKGLLVQQWRLAEKLMDTRQLNGVIGMRCTTNTGGVSYGFISFFMENDSLTIRRGVKLVRRMEILPLQDVYYDTKQENGGGTKHFQWNETKKYRILIFTVDSVSREYFDVAFYDKDVAKSCGARWDHERRAWYAPSPDVAERLSKNFKAIPVVCF